MKIQIQKWGNSLAIRIPKAFAQEISIDYGSMVELALEKGEIVVRPIDIQYSLDQLLTGITKDNIHAEIETGEAQGKEVW